jgi:peptidoglycan hydrolase-like protein with peptidoglycan-binding domain
MGTYALTVDHGSFWIRYGEIAQKPASALSPGTIVKEGEQIGEVGDLQGMDLAMVHFEMYSGAGSGPLTVPSRAPYMRRVDLLDPTPYLDEWAALAGRPATLMTQPILKFGNRGIAVIEWQRRLLNQGYAMALDGDFGSITETATKQFQRDSNLSDDGIVGPETYAEMTEAEKD